MKLGPIPSRVSLNVPVYDCEAVLGANEIWAQDRTTHGQGCV